MAATAHKWANKSAKISPRITEFNLIISVDSNSLSSSKIYDSEVASCPGYQLTLSKDMTNRVERNVLP
jgi:hypothetical protein